MIWTLLAFAAAWSPSVGRPPADPGVVRVDVAAVRAMVVDGIYIGQSAKDASHRLSATGFDLQRSPSSIAGTRGDVSMTVNLIHAAGSDVVAGISISSDLEEGRALAARMDGLARAHTPISSGLAVWTTVGRTCPADVACVSLRLGRKAVFEVHDGGSTASALRNLGARVVPDAAYVERVRLLRTVGAASILDGRMVPAGR